MDRQICTTRIDLERMLFDESAQPQALPLSLLDEITNGFSEEKEIGRGGFAVVYKGILGTETVAVKKLSHSYMHEKEYQREVVCLMKLARHKNIVRFLGYCADTQGSMYMSNKSFVLADLQQRLLCFEYVPNKSLQDYITDASRGIEWRKRYRIIKGVCEGLNYLHNNLIVHLDLKPGNILMDENMEPKIADFGLSRFIDEGQSMIMATKVSGTMGYMAPEIDSREVRPYYDIYSLGVIIIEILTGKKGHQRIDDVLDSWRNRLQEPVEDAELEQIRVCFNIGNECIEYDPAMRPSTQNILNRLKQTESADEPSSVKVYIYVSQKNKVICAH
ncbi:Cysteine-rich receptor-like protein kinase 10 [Dichanthelium oligosanthes]|uniref:Cysteine-rich receptor-like protein kinase 10 n=1 Tax=Dichanthelium oligosanthes TaxID=888268 RepID=A0A1E5WJ87_9POAL|nr:Cysteine-rich receptor-like protein kinase 10 [Dichanthelium oligosanthes]